VQFLSAEWFAAARPGLTDIALDSARSCRLNFTADTAQWHLCIDTGRVASFDLGHIDDADAELRWSMADTRAIVFRRRRGDDALRSTTVVARAADGQYVGPPAPLNLRQRPELDDLSTIPGATLTVQYLYQNGPFGDVNYGLSFRDGHCVDEFLGTIPQATVRVEVTYRTMALVRAGEMTILEALEDGRIEGSIGALGVLAGISEDPLFHRAELATGRHAIPLATLGDLDADNRYAPLMAQLESLTTA
jgi:hypothetical protein